MRKIYILLFVWLIFNTVYAQNKPFAIKGNTPLHLNDSSVMLFTFCKDEVMTIDTAVITDGKFYFEGASWEEEFSILTTGNYPYTVRSARLVLEPGTINVYLDKVSSIHGTPLNDTYQGYLSGIAMRGELLKKIENKKLNNLPADSLEKELDKYPVYSEFAKNNIGNVLGKEMFREYCEAMWYGEFLEIYELADEQLRAEVKISACYEKKIENKRNDEEKKKLEGSQILDFLLNTPDGKLKKLSDYLVDSEYVIFDFWASWCAPCVRDFKYLKEIYAKYKAKGVEIVGVSFDTKEKEWKNAIKKHELIWPQLSNLDGGVDIMQAYFMPGIPFTVVVNKEGTIVFIGYPAQYLIQLMDYVLE
ncbi:AhpC/TSA family protein [Parabacteroides sp. 52]|uniref:TlpA disulfide reductase family protein n=1 Tax=unclassified Parabacteroides TaxID=2649774 RepID=UPI0013D29D3A|nr:MULTISPECIES: TlpA disulfide reductase family protein [unclassified Parabacteroides]MDH6533766.1 peroxiredoxin [Parabacteroides sp. PM5-20]NDV54516.1 AhpC/TSA family protein [Parabacteroides sp. 52]